MCTDNFYERASNELKVRFSFGRNMTKKFIDFTILAA